MSNYKAASDHLEPAAVAVDDKLDLNVLSSIAMVSIAMSLKRIADCLEGDASTNGIRDILIDLKDNLR